MDLTHFYALCGKRRMQGREKREIPNFVLLCYPFLFRISNVRTHLTNFSEVSLYVNLKKCIHIYFINTVYDFAFLLVTKSNQIWLVKNCSKVAQILMHYLVLFVVALQISDSDWLIPFVYMYMNRVISFDTYVTEYRLCPWPTYRNCLGQRRLDAELVCLKFKILLRKY